MQKGETVRVYLPEEALQGEEIPSFALWQGTAFDGIRVQIPHGLKVAEVYNVSQSEWAFSGTELSVKQVEVNGYMGLVLTSEQLDETSKEVEVRWDFLRKNEKLSESRRIHVFRPLIEVEAPSQIQLEKSEKIVVNPLRIQNKGLGTVIIGVRASAESKAKLEEPQVVSDFEKSFKKDVKAGFSEIKPRFPDLHNLIDQVSAVFTEPPNLSEKEGVSRLQQIAENVNRINSENPEFGKSIGEVLGSALLANLQRFNIFQQLAEYIHSVEGRKVLMRNPLNTVRVGPGKSTLHLRVEYTDLAYGFYPQVEIKTVIQSDEEKTFPLYKLFRWDSTK